MLLLVSGASSTVDKITHPNIGQLKVPASGNSIDKIVKNGKPWACDNGCFSGFDDIEFLKMVKAATGKPRLLFVTVPDVVGDAKSTLELFKLWQPVLKKYYDVPLAYVLQNGVDPGEIPWESIAAVFIGGSTEWKVGKEAAEIVQIAKWKGKWVHMGRVNSFQRIRYAYTICCDSVDGSGYSMFPDQKIPEALKWLENEQTAIMQCFV